MAWVGNPGIAKSAGLNDVLAEFVKHLGEDGWPVLGNTVKLLADPIKFGDHMRQTYGDVFRNLPPPESHSDFSALSETQYGKL